MLTINMRIFKTAFLLIAGLCAAGNSLPIAEETATTTSSSPSQLLATDYYDQRQNGTENYRIHVDGLIVVVAPVETLLLAAGEPAASIGAKPSSPPLTDSNSTPASVSRPETDATRKPSSAKFAQRSSVRLMNLLAPLFRRANHD